MAVEKYKPKTTPHLFEEREMLNAEKAERVIRQGRQAVARARQLLEESRHAVQRAQRLRRHK
jgi:ribosomal protein S16